MLVPATLLGGEGNESLLGGGHDRLDGGSGNDTLQGRGGRTCSAAARGTIAAGRRATTCCSAATDTLRGGSGNDLLVGGRTIYDANTAALDQIHTLWTLRVAYSSRTQWLREGIGGTPRLTAAEITDTAVDSLLGEAGADYFYASSRDVLTGRTAAEERISV